MFFSYKVSCFFIIHLAATERLSYLFEFCISFLFLLFLVFSKAEKVSQNLYKICSRHNQKEEKLITQYYEIYKHYETINK